MLLKTSGEIFMGDKENINQKRGVGLRVFGSILILLGIINIIFSLKAGIEIQGFYILLIAAGTVLFIIGLRRNKDNYSL